MPVPILMQAGINYADMLGHSLQHQDLSAAPCVHRIHIAERDALMCNSLKQAALEEPGCIVGVVGADHLQGICSQWTSPTDYCCSQQQLCEKQTPAAEESPDVVGARRALLERFFELSSSPATCAALQHFLPALSAEACEAYDLTKEIYGSHRMMLASLSPQDLAKVSSLTAAARSVHVDIPANPCSLHMCEVLPVAAKMPVQFIA